MNEEFSWEQFDKACKKLAQKLKKKGKSIRAVYGVPRGGLILAVKLSHLLGIPLVLDPEKADLIVDEVCDSGKTLLKYKRKYKKLFATIHLKNNSRQPDYWLYKTKAWIVYPWEK